MTTKLSQIIAVEKGVKSDATRRVTDLHRDVQKAPLISGISRSYHPRDDEGDRLPPESTRVQVKADDVLAEVARGNGITVAPRGPLPRPPGTP